MVLAVAWGRCHVASLSRYLEAQLHRTRCNHGFCFVVARLDPELSLGQKVQVEGR